MRRGRNKVDRQGELAKAWLSQTVASKRAGNVFFEGDTIYSYGTHFPIARLLRNGTVFYNHYSYSLTTSAHQSAVLHLLRMSAKKIFRVGTLLVCESPSPKHVVAYQSEIDHIAENCKTERQHLTYSLDAMQRWFNEAVEFITLFHLDAETCRLRLPENLHELCQRAVRYRLGGIQETNRLLKRWELPKAVDWVILETILQTRDPLLLAMKLVNYRSELKKRTENENQ